MLSEFSLAGKVALVTGGGRGLGLEIAKLLAKAGAKVLLNGRNREALEQTIATFESCSENAIAMPFDVTDEIAVAAAFAKIGERQGGLDILINNVFQNPQRSLNILMKYSPARDCILPYHKTGRGRVKFKLGCGATF